MKYIILLLLIVSCTRTKTEHYDSPDTAYSPVKDSGGVYVAYIVDGKLHYQYEGGNFTSWGVITDRAFFRKFYPDLTLPPSKTVFNCDCNGCFFAPKNRF